MTLLNSGIDNYVYSNGKRYSYFGGNNYLGLANHPSVREAAISAIQKYGVNFSASRHTTGTSDIHLELERELSAFKGKEDAVVFASGFQGNGILLEILKGRYSTVFADQSAHASIISAIPADAVKVMYYDHCDAGHLENLLEHNRDSFPLIITDGVFALTGEIAPLDEIWPVVKKYKGMLVVDDAHSTGVLGNTGKGTPEHFKLLKEEDIFQTETMSKALGGYGGFISGSNDLTEMIRERSATYQASTALPPPIAAAGIASLKIINDNPDLRIQVIQKARRLRKEISGLGFKTTQFDTPIIPVIFERTEKAKSLSTYLEENGIIAPFMNYPARQEIHLIRIAVCANHTSDQIEILLEMLKKWRDKNERN